MLRKLCLTVVILAAFVIVGCVNPYVQKLKIYEMQISQGRDKVFIEAFEMTRVERLDIEDQFARQGLENALILAAFVRETEKKKEDVEKLKVFSYRDILDLIDKRSAANKQKKVKINAAYDKFFASIKEQDDKIKTINKAVKKAEEVRQETYRKVGKTLAVGLGTAGLAASFPK